jgi:hypothetical protein
VCVSEHPLLLHCIYAAERTEGWSNSKKGLIIIVNASLMSSKPKKYIFENGIMKSNPEYVAYMASVSGAPAAPSPPTRQDSVIPLTIVSSMADIAEATCIQQESTGVAMQVSFV